MASHALLLLCCVAACAGDVLSSALSRAHFYHRDVARRSDRYAYRSMKVSYNEPDNVTCSGCGWHVGGQWDYLWMRNDSSPVDPGSDQVVAPPIGLRSSPPLGGVSAGSVELRADGSFRGWTIFNQGPAGSGKYGLVDDVWMAARLGGVTRVLRTHPPPNAGGVGVEGLAFSGMYPLTRLQVQDSALGGLQLFAYSTLRPADLNASSFPAVALSLLVSNPGPDPQQASFMLNVPIGAWTDCSYSSANATIQAMGNYTQCMHACAGAPGCASWQYAAATRACSLNPDIPFTAHAVGVRCGVSQAASWSASPTGLSWSQGMGVQSPSSGGVTLAAAGDATYGTHDDPAALLSEFARTGGFGGSAVAGVAANGAVSVSTTVAPHSNVTLNLVFSWHFPHRNYAAGGVKGYGEVLGNGYANLWANSSQVAAEMVAPGKLASVVEDILAHHNAVAHIDNPTPDWLKDMLVNQFSHFSMLMWYKDGRMREYEAWSCDDVDSVHNDFQRHLLYQWMFPDFERQKVEAWGSWAQSSTDGHVDECLAGFGHGPLDRPGGRLMGDTTTLFVLELYEILLHTGDLAFIQKMWPSAKRALEWCMTNANGNDNYGLPQFITTTYDHFQFERHRAVTYNAHVYQAALTAGIKLAEAVQDAAGAQALADSLSISQKAIVDDRLWNSSHHFFRCHTDTVWHTYTKETAFGVSFKHAVGFLALGNDYSPPVNTSFAACQAACAGAAACLGFTFASNDPVPTYQVLCYTKTALHFTATTPMPNQVFTDTLYGQMLAHHFLNHTFTIDKSYLQGHLAYEWQANQDAYGMRVLSDPVQEDSIWMNGPPTHAYLQVALGDMSIDDALEPLKRMSENFRLRLRDMWNLRALTHTDGSIPPAETTRPIEQGAPREQGHYGFMLTDTYLYPLLSGQQVNLAEGKLVLSPLFQAPYVLPVLLSGVEGSIASDQAGNYTLSIAFGKLQLPTGGLIVDGTAYPHVVDLTAGERISWNSNNLA